MAAHLIDFEAEKLLRQAADELTDPGHGECLICYLNRMWGAFGCNRSLRFMRRFRDRTAPRATALEKRLNRSCDCHVLVSSVEPAFHLWVIPWHPAHDEWDDCPEPQPPEPQDMPECQRVRRGSTQPCANWQRWTGLCC